jgi:BACON domain-containing protein/all-beta uncharacterized protein
MTPTSSFDTRERVGSRSLTAAVVFVGAALVAGCQTSSTATDVTVAPDAPKCQVTAATPGAVEATGGMSKFSVTAQPECSWTASTSVNWISSVSPGSGQGTHDVEFRVAPNESSAAREGDIVVNETRVRVSQKAPCRYAVSPANQAMSASGGTGSVSVTAGSDCSWSANSDSGWLALTGSTSGLGTATVSFNVSANGNTERTGSITVAGQRATVTQAAQGSPAPVPGPSPSPGCTYTIAPTSADVAALGATGSIAVTTQSGCQWSASSNASWISVTSGASGSGNGSVAFTVAVNLGGARSGTIGVAGRSFTVNQAAVVNTPTCTYKVSPTDIKVGKDGGSKSIKVDTSAGCSWSASSNASWITITSGASGSGDGSVSISIAKNTVKSKRTGTVTVAGQTVSVEQDGA